jgi:hypothetical protein
MTRERLGKYFFYLTLVLSLGLFIYGITLKAPENTAEAQETIGRYKNILSFFAFGLVIPLGLIVREYLSVPHDPLKMRIKTLVSLAVFTGGLLILIFTRGVAASQISLYVSLILLIYVLVPTKTNENKTL